MNCTVFLIVRTSSTRLPKKALLEINHQPLIKILIDRIKTAKKAREIIVCTTTHKSDDKLVKFLTNNNIKVFRGDRKDILNRLYLAAKKYKVKQFVVVEGDDVFCEPILIDETCKKLSQTKYDFLYWKNLPFGVSPLGIKTSKLEILVKSKATKNTETGWGRFIVESEVFKVGQIRPRFKKWIRPDIRLSVDYPEDFQLVKILYRKLPRKFTLTDLIKLLDKNPELQKINESVKYKYEQNFTRKMTKIAFKRKVRSK
ncbi:MAG: NTP transferase domain-containing protein [Thaumarchaeota archaeon]|nr:NTP transferase domain-containing protein [Nitrososphaerota archaeon]